MNILTEDKIKRISRQTSFTVTQIKNYIKRVAGDDVKMENDIREANMFEIDIDLLGR